MHQPEYPAGFANRRSGPTARYDPFPVRSKPYQLQQLRSSPITWPIFTAIRHKRRKPRSPPICLIHGLPLFENDQVYDFSSAGLDHQWTYTGAPLNNDTSGHQSLPALRAAFLAHVSEAIIVGGPVNAPPPVAPNPAQFADSCLVATLGYLDVTVMPTNTKPFGLAEKVWVIRPAHSSYPTVFVVDETGFAWGQGLTVP